MGCHSVTSWTWSKQMETPPLNGLGWSHGGQDGFPGLCVSFWIPFPHEKTWACRVYLQTMLQDPGFSKRWWIASTRGIEMNCSWKSISGHHSDGKGCYVFYRESSLFTKNRNHICFSYRIVWSVKFGRLPVVGKTAFSALITISEGFLLWIHSAGAVCIQVHMY